MEPNSAQQRAIELINGQAVLIACPGSGKTTTLLKRISYMVDHGIDPENILMVTFTKASADEMKSRFKKNYSGINGVTFSTIHAFCLAVLKKFASNRVMNIVNPIDVSTFFADALKRKSDIIDKGEFIITLKTDISVVKNNMMTLGEYNPRCGDKGLFIDLFNAYEEWKESTGQIDYDDMLIMAYEVMRDDEICIKWLRDKFRYVQVDEYQDINNLQKSIIYQLVGKNGNLMVVGDDDQSIYGFRGARPGIMLNFKRNYPHAEEIYMSTNYRSGTQIIDVAGSLIKNNKKRFRKEFQAFNPRNGEVRLFNTQSPEKSYVNMIKKIQEKNQSGTPLEEMAVLYRINTQATAISDYFLRAGIDFTSNEIIPSKYDHWIYRDVECYRKVATGNFSKLEFSIILNHPNRFLYGKQFYRTDMTIKGMMIAAQSLDGWKRDKAYENISSMFYILNAFKTKSPHDALMVLERHGKYREFLKEYNSKRKLEENELTQIWDLILQEAAEYESWEEWEAHIAENKYMLKEKLKKKTGVLLSTMHRSKGLEWSSVFIIDCVDGRIPSRKAATDEEVEEERRLFYVAITRARRNLYMYTYGPLSKRSPFLRELPVKTESENRDYSSDTRNINRKRRNYQPQYSYNTGIQTNYAEAMESNYISKRNYSIGEGIHHKKYGDQL